MALHRHFELFNNAPHCALIFRWHHDGSTAAMTDNTESRSFGVNCSLSSLMEDTMEYFFTELDKDGDGTFDLAEFSDLVRILADEEGHVLQDWLIDRMQDLRVHCDSEHGAEHGPAH